MTKTPEPLRGTYEKCELAKLTELTASVHGPLTSATPSFIFWMPSGGGQSPPSYYLLLEFSRLVCAYGKQKGRELPSPCRMKFKFEPPQSLF